MFQLVTYLRKNAIPSYSFIAPLLVITRFTSTESTIKSQ